MSIAPAPEHDWSVAAPLVMAILLPVANIGVDAAGVDRASVRIGHHGGSTLHWAGPAGLHVGVAIPATGYDVLVNTDHLVTWDVETDAILSTALANLESWSNSTPWEEEVAGERRLLVSDSGEGWDAGRLLLPSVRLYLERELGKQGRILVAIPNRHLLLAGSLRPDDVTFMEDLQSFVAIEAADADEPVDGRLFELVQGGLVEVTA